MKNGLGSVSKKEFLKFVENFPEYVAKGVEFIDSEYNHLVMRRYQYVLTIKPNNCFNGESYLDKDCFRIRTFEKYWDFVKWLNVK